MANGAADEFMEELNCAAGIPCPAICTKGIEQPRAVQDPAAEYGEFARQTLDVELR